ncbi:MAG: GGDEF domain-containing protein [Oxalobacteraceae bacterium]|nr:MAG: GGDEF domain-containing protein [Oxalobacteraceae bacterium]
MRRKTADGMPSMPDRRPRISPDVYSALISDLAYSSIPTTIMGLVLVAVGIIAMIDIGNRIFLVPVAAAAVATAGKLIIMRAQRRQMTNGLLMFADASAYQDRHLIVTLVAAGSAAATTTLLFLYPETSWHIVATALLFAYCSGVVGRLSLCPPLALTALTVATSPVIIACGYWNDIPHRITTLMFCVFLLASFETVRHVHHRAARYIATELDMAMLARNDPLTGALNRLGLGRAFRDKAASLGSLAIHFLDLDGFKAVNDEHGHAAGDRVLVEVACRLTSLEPGLTVARMGGDEFAVLQYGLGRDEEAVSLAQRIVAIIGKPYEIADREIHIGVSLGFVVAANQGMNLDALLRQADEAAYSAKRAGGGLERGNISPVQGLPRAKLRVVT